MWWSSSDGFRKGVQVDLLLQERILSGKLWLFREITGESIKLAEISCVECKQDFTEPGVWCILETVENRVEEQFSKVVDVPGEEGGDGKVVGPADLIFEG